MAKNKKSFVGYCDWDNIFQMLSDEEAGRLIKHLFAYVNDKSPTLEDRMLTIVFEPIRLQLERDLTKYEEVKKKRSEAGRKGGAPVGNTNAKKTSKTSNCLKKQAKQAKQADNVNDTVTVTDTVNDISIYSEKNADDINAEKTDVYPFDDFWDDYDKKVDKVKVKRIWSKISDSNKLKVKEHIPAYKKSQPDKQFRKNPQTYLNSQSWENEIISIEKKNNGYEPEATKRQYHQF